MRHLLVLLALAIGLTACDDSSSTAPIETIPSPPDAPRLSVTVLTGTKAAPVDSPTVKVQWWYTGTSSIGVVGLSDIVLQYDSSATFAVFSPNGSGDSTIKVGCAGKGNIKYAVYAGATQGAGKYVVDTVSVYCK